MSSISGQRQRAAASLKEPEPPWIATRMESSFPKRKSPAGFGGAFEVSVSMGA
jgi:hypothetical protein